MAHEMPGMCLDARKVSEFDDLHKELLDSVGMLLPMLEVACEAEGDQRSRCLQLAKATCTRGAVAVKALLWQWEGLKNRAQEQEGLVKADALRREFEMVTKEQTRT